MDYVIVGILGLVIGSFLNVCIYRIPKEESISYPPSHCSNCESRLGPLDLVPLLSYMFLGGECRYCKEKISIQYPIIEALNGGLYLLIYEEYGPRTLTLKYFSLVSILIVISIIDLKTQYVYSSTSIFAGITAIVFIALESFQGKEGTVDLILGGLVGFLIIKIIIFLTSGMGDGDAEIAAVCGLFLGVQGILLGIFLGIIIGGLVGSIALILKFKKGSESIAFGPCISIGVVISMLYSSQILDWYLGMVY